MRQELFGSASPELYGFSRLQKFFDLQERVVLDVQHLIEHPVYTLSVNREPHALSRDNCPFDSRAYQAVKKGYFQGGSY